MVLYVKADTNEKSVIQIAWFMLSVELGQRLVDDNGEQLPTPVPNWPKYTKDGHTFNIRSTDNMIFVGVGVDIDTLARTLADLCTRLQAPDHFCRPMPIVGTVTTVFVKPSQSSTEVNPTRAAGRGIYTQTSVNTLCFYNWTIRRINDLPYDDPDRISIPKDAIDEINTLGSIVWDVDNVFIHEHGAMPIILTMGDFRAIAEGRLKIIYDPPSTTHKNKQLVNTIVLMEGDFTEPGILTLHKSDNAMIGNSTTVHALPIQDFQDCRNADNREHVCGICGCTLFGHAYRFKPDVRMCCIRCLADSSASHAGKRPSRRKLSAMPRDKYVNAHPLGHILNDVKDGIERRHVAGIRFYFGKINAYISSADPVLWNGPALYDHDGLEFRTIYVAGIYARTAAET